MAYQKYFTLSFDDGLEQDKKLINLLKKYELQCTFNLNSGLLGKHCRIGRIGNIGIKEFDETDKFHSVLMKNHDHYRIPENEIKQVYEGFEVASHAYMHEMLSKIPADQMKKSIDNDIEKLSSIVGYKISGHAYPFGSTSDEVVTYLKEKGILYGRKVMATHSFVMPEDPFRLRPTCSHQDKKGMDLMDDFLVAQPETNDLMFYMWGHGYELDFGTEFSSWKHLENIFEKIAGHDDIVYCTNQQIYKK